MKKKACSSFRTQRVNVSSQIKYLLALAVATAILPSSAISFFYALNHGLYTTCAKVEHSSLPTQRVNLALQIKYFLALALATSIVPSWEVLFYYALDHRP